MDADYAAVSMQVITRLVVVFASSRPRSPLLSDAVRDEGTSLAVADEAVLCQQPSPSFLRTLSLRRTCSTDCVFHALSLLNQHEALVCSIFSFWCCGTYKSIVIIPLDHMIISWSKLFNGKNEAKMHEETTIVTFDQIQPNWKDSSIEYVRGLGRLLFMRAPELSTEKSTLQQVSMPRDLKRPSASE